MPTATNRPQIAVIVGSNRRDSINRKLAQALAKLGADKFDAHFVRIDDLPLYNQDNEANLPVEVSERAACGDGGTCGRGDVSASIRSALGRRFGRGRD